MLGSSITLKSRVQGSTVIIYTWVQGSTGVLYMEGKGNPAVIKNGLRNSCRPVDGSPS